MSVIGGPNNPISNGLVYALDFKNNRSYVSGSTSARSLTFTTATATVTGSNIYQIPNLVNGLLQFNLGSSATTGSWIQIPTIFDSVNSLGQFTILVTAEGKSDNNFLSDTSDTANTRWGAGLGSQIGLGFGQGQSTQYGRGFTNPATSLSHIVYRYSSGSFTIFVNGFPISSSNTSFSQNRSQGGSSFFISGRHPQQDALWSGSLGNVFIYNRALTNDEVRSNYTLASREYGLPTPPSFSIDENAYLFSQTAGITSSAYITALDTFVRGLKSASLWDKMVGIYPFLGGNNTLNQLNLKESSLTVYPASFTGSWSSSFSGSRNNTTASYATLTGLTPSTYHPLVNTQSFHMAYLSYDTPTTSGSLMGAGTPVFASGGAVLYGTDGTVYHIFTAAGTSSFTVDKAANVEVMVVAGGGGGGACIAGGGGAGGLIFSSSFSLSTGSYQVIVGAGGSGSLVRGTTGSKGQDSAFGSIISFGGGGGGGYAGVAGASGGSGGGGNGFGGSGTLGQGNNGGLGSGERGGGGGGGAGTAGGTGSGAGDTGSNGAGGSGSYYPQYVATGYGFPAGWFAGGGDGGGRSPGGGVPYYIYNRGGIGGGGSGSITGVKAQNGVVNTGGGGGGGGFDGSDGTGGNGGSGIVIVAYKNPTYLEATPSTITGTVNSPAYGTFSAGGPLGLVMTSRTGSRAYSVSKNKVIFNYTSSASSSISNNLLLNAVNINGTASFPSQNNVAYASVGAGLSNDETRTYYDLVSKLQYDLGRGLLIEGFPAAAAYSVRQLSKTAQYSMEVRRDWDNASGSFGFDLNGNLDTGSLLAFVTGSAGTGSGFVQTWYDQSGNSKHAIQTTNIKQPIIVISGSVFLENGKPAILFTGGNVATQTGFTASVVTSTPSDYSVYYVKNAKGGQNPWLIMFGNSSYLTSTSPGFATTFYLEDGPGRTLIGTSATPQRQHVGEIYLNSSNNLDSRAYENNALQKQGFTSNTYTKVSIPNLLISVNSFQAYTGSAQEIILSTNNYLPSRSAIISNINSYFNIY
jgi:hypothetical protein